MSSYQCGGVGRAVLLAGVLFAGLAASRADAQAPASVFGTRAAQQAGQPQPQPATQNPAPSPVLQRPASVINSGGPAAPGAIGTQSPSAVRNPLVVPGPGAVPAPQSPVSRLGNSIGAVQLAKKAGGVIKSTQVKVYSPRRNELLNRQNRLLTEQNALAQRYHTSAAAASQNGSVPTPRAVNGSLTDRAGLMASSTFGSQLTSNAARARAYPNARVLGDGIYLVNGKEHDLTVTPGGQIAISGHGFGDGPGRVVIVSNDSSTSVAFQIGEWQDGMIYASLPAGLRGIRDRPMKLQVTTRTGKVYAFDDAKFYAAREEILISTRVLSIMHVVPGASWPNARVEDSGLVTRSDLALNGSLDCRPPGADRLTFAPLPNGYELTGVVMWHDRTDAGDGVDGLPGSRVFFPGYSIGDWATEPIAGDGLNSSYQDALTINWGVWRAHYSPSSDLCNSQYQIALTAVGPAGVSIF
jgi:hypothetical protein